jgi:L-amino acid N-acyltransferase YncA
VQVTHGRVDNGAVRIDDLRPSDWPAVAAIYAEGIATGVATFEAEVPSYATWDAAHLAAPRLVPRDCARVAGWAALMAVSRRPVYAGVADESVYVAAADHARGVGRLLLEEPIRRSEDVGIWTLQAGIFPENEASLRLHRACGFRVVGVRERIGRHGEAWRDVVLLERRSGRVGCDNGAP